MQHLKVQVLEVKTDAVTKKKKIQQRWDGCQITDRLFCQWDVPSTRRSNESRGALKRERTFSSVPFLFPDKKRRKKSSVRNLHSCDQGIRQKKAEFGNTSDFYFEGGVMFLVMWSCGGDYTACLLFECFKWLDEAKNTHVHVQQLE